MVYVQYGCGYAAPEGWLNFDSSPTLKLERVPVFGLLVRKNATRFPRSVIPADIVSGLPVPAGTADGVYASHVLEHLTRSDFEVALQNTFRLLRPGGVFRLIVPDLEARARMYLEKVQAGDQHASDWFMIATHLGVQRRPKSLIDRASRLFGGSMHLWMWDFNGMKTQLERAGFADVRRCSIGDSKDKMFAKVEDAQRFFDATYGIEELAIEAKKPASKAL